MAGKVVGLGFEITSKLQRYFLITVYTVTPMPRTALLMCLKKYSALGNSAIGNYVVSYSKLILKTVLIEVSYGKND